MAVENWPGRLDLRQAEAQPSTQSRAKAATSRDASLDYLRAFVTLLVVAYHTVLAYSLLGAASPRSPLFPWFSAVPVVDSHRAIGFDLFVVFDAIFFMSLMFFLSGLFVGPALRRKGGGDFLRDRALRLGAPFLVMALLAPLAYYPAYLATATNPGPLEFWRKWLSLGVWPIGPLWFVAVLLVYDIIAAAGRWLAPGPIERIGRLALEGRRRPAAVFAALILVSAVAYLPLFAAFGPEKWVKVGPIYLQGSRILHYLVYFLAGVAVGECGIDKGLLAPDGRLAQLWLRWSLTALGVFAVYLAITVRLAQAPGGSAPFALQMILGPGFVLCCGAISFAFLAVFRRFATAHVPALDSLSRNAYGIYLIHYGFVMGLQYALLPAEMPASAKAAIVFCGALAASWAATAVLRRIPAVARVI